MVPVLFVAALGLAPAQDALAAGREDRALVPHRRLRLGVLHAPVVVSLAMSLPLVETVADPSPGRELDYCRHPRAGPDPPLRPRALRAAGDGAIVPAGPAPDARGISQEHRLSSGAGPRDGLRARRAGRRGALARRPPPVFAPGDGVRGVAAPPLRAELADRPRELPSRGGRGPYPVPALPQRPHPRGRLSHAAHAGRPHPAPLHQRQPRRAARVARAGEPSRRSPPALLPPPWWSAPGEAASATTCGASRAPPA